MKLAWTAGLAGAAAAELAHVSVVVRHGAREELTKDPRTFGEGGTQLTPTGQWQLYELGQQLHDRYGNLTADYAPGLVHVRSSDYDRTMASAQAALLGMWPVDPSGSSLLPNQPLLVPVHTVPEEDDVLLRAYTKCDTFSTLVEDWYGSDTFAAKQEAWAADLAAQAEAFSDVYDAAEVTLEGYWNFFDTVNVKNDAYLAGTWADAPGDWDSRMTEYFPLIEEIADWAESHKFSASVAQSFVGANLANELLGNALAAPELEFQLYAAHYPTIMGLLSALGLGLDEIPGYGAALAMEVAEDGSVALRYQDRYDGEPVELFAGTQDEWAVLVRSRVPATTSEWCRACGNDEARDCLEAFAVASTVQTAVNTGAMAAYAAAFFLAAGMVAVWLWQGMASSAAPRLASF